ncbi:hypothetical protein SISSUDRAFT_1054850, partial [Sistotremastrum suecicum HHB10207 ss-3]
MAALTLEGPAQNLLSRLQGESYETAFRVAALVEIGRPMMIESLSDAYRTIVNVCFIASVRDGVRTALRNPLTNVSSDDKTAIHEVLLRYEKESKSIRKY